MSDAEAANALIKGNDQATLSTWSVHEPGYPFGSVMPYVLDDHLNPVFLASKLAEHTANFLADSRASLMVAESGHSDSLALARVTLVGNVEIVDDEVLRTRYLEQHPSANMYVDFDDFAFYKLSVTAIRYVGGFGKMSWVKPGMKPGVKS
ncbi:MAG: pyridoxamine 5'-phosphate oxidase family protein [Actinomycetota bacterium]